MKHDFVRSKVGGKRHVWDVYILNKMQINLSLNKAFTNNVEKILLFQVLELEGEKGEWGFKALKQMIKINFKLVGITAVT